MITSIWKRAIEVKGYEFIQVIHTIDPDIPVLPYELNLCSSQSLTCFSTLNFTSLKLPRSISDDSYFTKERIDKISKIVEKERRLDTSELIVGDIIGVGISSIVCKAIFRGGNAVVKKMKIDSDYALKNRTNHDALENDQIDVFLSEVLVSSKLPSHAHVVQFYGCIFQNCEVWLVSEYVPGHNMRRALDIGALNENDKIFYALQVSSGFLLFFLDFLFLGLWHLHSSNVVHRDLSARNLFVDNRSNSIKIGDFGLSRYLPGHKLNDANLLNVQNNFGSIPWMSPESIKNRVFNEKSDIYSFGIVLYELVTQKIPFDEYQNNPELAIDSILNGRISINIDLKSKILAFLADMMSKCINVNPNERPTAKQLYLIIESSIKSICI